MAFTTNFDEGDYEDVLQRYSTTSLRQAEDVANRPFTPYGGDRVAGFSPTEIAGRQRAAQLAQQGLGMPQATEAGDVYQRLANFQAGTYDPTIFGEMDISGYIPEFGRVDPELMREANIEQYMSPYQQGVTDIALREMERQRQIEEQGLGAQASAAGAFGGSRQAILEAELARNYGQRAADVITMGQQQAFANAQQQAAADLARLNQAQMQNIGLGMEEFGMGVGLAQTDIDRMNQAQIQNEQFRQQAAEIQAMGAGGLQSSADQMRRLGYADADVLRTLGAEERGLQQAQMDIDYGEFMRQQAFPSQALSARLSPLGYGASVAGAAPTINQPSAFQSLLGNLGAIGQVGTMIGGGYSALTGRSLF